MEMDEEGQRAVATIESLSIERDDFEGNSMEDGLWDKISYGTSTDDAVMDVSDDILTLTIPPTSFGRTASENFANDLLSQMDNHDALLAAEHGVDTLDEIDINSPSSALFHVSSRPEADLSQLEFSVTVEAGRQSAYIFKDRSLFAKMNTSVVFVVHCPVTPPPGSFIRICAVYSDKIYANIPVHRCDYHRSRDRLLEEHFLVVVNNGKAQHLTEKVEGEEGLRSFVILPFDALPTNGCIKLQFRCYSSCVGAINRRAVQLCFSLENGSHLLGDSEMQLKVCSLPSRDANLDVVSVPRGRRPALKRIPTFAEVVSVSTKNASQPDWEDDDTIYSLEIRGKHLYKIVCAIVGNFELTRRLLKDKDQANSKNMLTVSNASNLLSQDTPIDSWLDTLDLSKYKQLFADRSLYVIADLDGIISKVYLLSLGVTEEDVTKMLSSYLAWFNVFNAERLSSLSSDGSTVRVRRTRVSGSIRAANSPRPK